MKTINLYFDFEFTSLSPDAQCISVGIVSDGIEKTLMPPTDVYHETVNVSKSFYAEFSDFDLNRCDDWVKEKVVGRLYLKDKFGKSARHTNGFNWECSGDMNSLIFHVKEWLKQFSDYQIQFVCDCGTYDWYWMVQLLAEWDNTANDQGFLGQCPTCYQEGILNYRTGLPKLPKNISPVPEDLNDLIARTKGISIREAFDLNREELAYCKIDLRGEPECFGKRVENSLEIERIENKKHNALWDAKVIKEIYQKLK